MPVLTLTQMIEETYYFTQVPYPYHESLRPYFILLWEFGARSNEPFDLSRWSVSGEDLILNPYKGNNPRVYPGAVYSNEAFYLDIFYRRQPFGGVRLSGAMNLYNKLKHYDLYSPDGKSIDLYLFRYTQIKTRSFFGASNAEIADYMGYTSVQPVTNYLSMNLTYN